MASIADDISAAPGTTEQSLYALIALLKDTDAFAERLERYVAARTEAEHRLKAAVAAEERLQEREREAGRLKTEAEEALALYRRELDELTRRREAAEALQSDLFAARAKMEADATEARREVEDKAAALKTITDGLEERERLAAQVFEQGVALQKQFSAKLDALKTIAAAG